MVIAEGKTRLAHVDDDGVTFTLPPQRRPMHRFTPEVSMRIQHELGADIMFAFDELTTLMNTRGYQERSVERTQAWAVRCLAEHGRLTTQRAGRPYQALFGVVQGAQYEDLRRRAARGLAALTLEVDGRGFDGFGIGGALEKENLGTIVRLGRPRNCRSTSHDTCWGSPSRTTSSPPSRPGPTPSTA